MNLIYSHSYHSARAFAYKQELAAGDWKWINDGSVIRDYPRSDIYVIPRWDENPHRRDIDAAIAHMRDKRRLGHVSDYARGEVRLGGG